MMAFLFSLASLIFPPTWAASAPEGPQLKAPPFTVDVRVTPQQELEFKAKPPASYHFNVDAPMSLTLAGSRSVAPSGVSTVKPLVEKESEVRFHAPIPSGSGADYTFSIYMCDDAKSFCEKHTLSGHWVIPSAGSSAALASDWSSLDLKPAASSTNTSTTSSTESSPLKSNTDQHGFLLNDADTALAQAKAGGKPLLIDFFGIWCPPCNELDEEVFGSPEFKKASAGFVKLKLDVDTSASWALKSRYKVSGYPTVILAASDGDEITRIIGSRPRTEFVRRIRQGWESRNEPFTVLKTKADAGDLAASGRLGMILLDRHEFSQAQVYLEKANPTPEHGEALSAARIGVLTDKGGAPLIEAYEASLRAYPSTPESIDRREALAELIASVKPEGWENKRKQLLTEVVTTGQALVRKPEALVAHDLSPGDLWEAIANAQEQLGDPEAAKKSWREGAKAYGARIHSDKERGNSLEQAYCLWHAGNAAAAEKLYRKLEKYYPSEFTYYFSHARMAFHLKQLDAAKELASQAYAHSYGDNRLRVAHLYAEVLNAHGDKKEAQKLITETLAAAEIPADPTIRTRRYADQLKALQTELK